MNSTPAATNDGARLEVVRGTRAGLVFPLTGEVVTIGRGPECQLRLDPAADLEVSGRHAALVRRSAGWCVRDLESRNGTFLNGAALGAEAPLADGDRIALGANGPVLVFHAQSVAAGTPPREPASRLALAGLIAVLLLGASAFLYLDRREQRAWERERTGLQLSLDSLRVESEQAEAHMGGQVQGLAQALRASRDRVARLQGELTQAASSGDRAAGSGIARRLVETGNRLRGQRAAASLDFAAIQRSNRRATARLYVEFEDGTVAVATAFVVQADGLLLSNRHAVLGEGAPRRPRRLALQFTDSEQIFPARLVATADSADLAVVRVENIEGGIPVVRGLNLRPDTLPAGAPVALIGFPLGGGEPATAAGGRQPLARAILGAGVLRTVSADRLELEGYGAQGASGSPIFDAAGEVVGVLFGGREDSAGQTLYAVPATTAARLLEVVRRSGVE